MIFKCKINMMLTKRCTKVIMCMKIKLIVKHEPFESVVRSKGIAWLCTRHYQGGIYSFAGRLAEVTPGPPWWDGIPKSEWPEGLEEELKPLWDSKHGDRQQVS